MSIRTHVMLVMLAAPLLIIQLPACEMADHQPDPESGQPEIKSESISDTRQIIPWIIDQGTCNMNGSERTRDTGVADLGQSEELFGLRFSETFMCDSIWGFAEAKVRFISFDSTIVCAVVRPSGKNLRDWSPPESVVLLDGGQDSTPENPMHSLVLDSRESYDTAFQYRYFAVTIGNTPWAGAVEKIVYHENDTGTVIFMVPTISPLTYLLPQRFAELDTIEGAYYHWNGYRYLAVEGLHYCWSGMYNPVKDVGSRNWLYRIKLPPEYERFLLYDEKNKLDTSCADIEQVRIVGWVGDGLWQPHGPDNIPTLYAMEVKVLSTGMSDRFREARQRRVR